MGLGLPEQIEKGPYRTKSRRGSYKSFLKRTAHKISRRAWRDRGELVDKAYKGYEL